MILSYPKTKTENAPKRRKLEVDVRVRAVPVSLPCWPEQTLQLVIVKGFGKAPLMLLTNVSVKDDERLPIIISKVY